MDKYEKEIADAYSKGKLELKDPEDELLKQLAEAGTPNL